MQEERIRIISDYLRNRSSATVPELASMLHVSLDTIRRDLRLLERRGLVSKVHGGAVLTSAYERENIYPIRQTSNIKEKDEIALKSSALVQDGQFLAINAGTTGNQLAKRLVSTMRLLTVLTNSISVAQILAENPGFTVILCGGDLNPTESSLGGRLAEHGCSQYYTDIAFISINAVSLSSGLSDFRVAEVGVINTLIPRAKRNIVIAASSKLEKKSHIFVSPLSSIDTIITDSRVAPEVAELYRSGGIDLLY
ncbi:MAG: DeoR/GlpR transcriptional regulator [Clostridia bacterium]|nr:DeoR/GlpR transcriptional regulator [Clostridia bacterium]